MTFTERVKKLKFCSTVAKSDSKEEVIPKIRVSILRGNFQPKLEVNVKRSLGLNIHGRKTLGRKRICKTSANLLKVIV